MSRHPSGSKMADCSSAAPTAAPPRCYASTGPRLRSCGANAWCGSIFPIRCGLAIPSTPRRATSARRRFRLPTLRRGASSGATGRLPALLCSPWERNSWFSMKTALSPWRRRRRPVWRCEAGSLYSRPPHGPLQRSQAAGSMHVTSIRSSRSPGVKAPRRCLRRRRGALVSSVYGTHSPPPLQNSESVDRQSRHGHIRVSRVQPQLRGEQRGQERAIRGSSDPMFRGDRSRYNPEEMLVGALSTCHMLWVLHLCADAGIVITEYADEATGEMAEHPDGSGEFTRVVLHPRVVITDPARIADATAIHERAHQVCCLARSVNFPVEHDVVVSAVEA